MNNAPAELRDADEDPTPVSPETAETTEGDGPSLLGRWASRVNDWRHAKVVSAETRAAQARLVQLRKEQEQRETETRAAKAAVARRKAAGRGPDTGPSDDEIAPLPQWLRIAGVWFNRSFGALPLVAPLIVSAVFTVKSGTSEPLSLPWPVAVLLALAFEGGIWKTATLYEKVRIEGDSTVGHRLLITFLILLNATFIVSHSLLELIKDATSDTAHIGQVDAEMIAKWAPALIAGLMSTIGVFVWSKQAAYKHRVRLRENDLIDTRAPKFSVWSWLLWPGETWCSLRHAVRYRITSPLLAVDDRRLWKMSGKPTVWPLVSETETEVVSESRPVPPIASETPGRLSRPAPSQETARAGAVPTGRLIAPSQETTGEPSTFSPLVSGETGETGEIDEIETVGRLHRDTQMSYAEIALRLGMSKPKAHRLGQRYYERLRLRLETAGDDETKVAN